MQRKIRINDAENMLKSVPEVEVEVEERNRPVVTRYSGTSEGQNTVARDPIKTETTDPDPERTKRILGGGQ